MGVRGRAVLTWMVFWMLASCGTETVYADKLNWALAGSAVSDVVSTRYALSRVGAREANPVMAGNRAIGGTAVSVGLVVWLSGRVARDGHGRAAKWLKVAIVAGHGIASVSNLRIGRR